MVVALRNEPNLLWVKVISSIHNLANKPNNYYSMESIAGAWNNIACIEKEQIKMGIPPNDVIKKHEVSNGYSWTCSLTDDGSYQVRTLRQVIKVNNRVDT